ncbi:MAG TPA: hopanoid biosynthesis-associated protein HpnK [Candidatus Saccharimonadales bacterium]|nr:hopanoid biosynthesis-associated protein HpnK [Candidatus Saccharimonadales bacterium]
MEPRDAVRRLIVNADDFGRSRSINEAVIRAHREGILTTTSLMVNEPAADEAIALARQNPKLGVGLHLTLVCGSSTLSAAQIPALVNAQKQFSNNPVASGLRYFTSARCRAQLRDEIKAQFAKFQASGLLLDHVNGHLNIHLHPTILKIILDNMGRSPMRLTYDPFFLNARLAAGRWGYRFSHAVIYWILSNRARPLLAQRRIRHTEAVFGLLQNGCVDSDYITKLLPCLPPGDSELYSHPSLGQFAHELDALINPTVRALAQKLGLQLIRYQDL